MTRRTINLFMWGFQEHFGIGVRLLVEDVFKRIGAFPEAEVLLVGVKVPGAEVGHKVCVEPEDGRWPLALFEALDEEVEREIPNHPARDMFYGSSEAMRDKPGNIRKDTVRTLVKRRLEPYDLENNVSSYVAEVVPVDGYHVATVIQVPRSTVDAHPEIDGLGWNREAYRFSFLGCCLQRVGQEAASDLLRPEPGRGVRGDRRNAEEVVRLAATDFMRHVASRIEPRHLGDGLWQLLNQVASLKYEGRDRGGHVALVEGPAQASFTLELAVPAPWHEARWCRKLLEMSTADRPLVATPSHILGVGQRLNQEGEHDFSLNFRAQHDWELRAGAKLLLRVQAGNPSLPLAAVPPERFLDTLGRLFPETTGDDRQRLLDVLGAQAGRTHGSLVVIAADAEDEAQRLGKQSMMTRPSLATEDLLASGSRIDGAMLLDPRGLCHAIGVVLDGPAQEDCTPARGARYNSALRYVRASPVSRLAIVVSDDHTVDVLGLLRPRIPAAGVERAIQELEASTADNFHKSRLFLDQYRFYLDEARCERVNKALDRIEDEPLEVGRIMFNTKRFSRHPDFDDTYLS